MARGSSYRALAGDRDRLRLILNCESRGDDVLDSRTKPDELASELELGIALCALSWTGSSFLHMKTFALTLIGLSRIDSWLVRGLCHLMFDALWWTRVSLQINNSWCVVPPKPSQSTVRNCPHLKRRSPPFYPSHPPTSLPTQLKHCSSLIQQPRPIKHLIRIARSVDCHCRGSITRPTCRSKTCSKLVSSQNPFPPSAFVVRRAVCRDLRSSTRGHR